MRLFRNSGAGKCGLLALIVASLSTLAVGQNSPAVPLTLADAETLALKNHPRIATAQNEASAQSQRVVQARSAYYPNINGEITAAQGLSGSRLGAGTLASSLLLSKFGQGLQINQLVTDLGRTRNLVAEAKLQAQAADQFTRATRFDVILDVDRAYFEVLQAQAFVQVGEQTVASRQTLANQVSALANAQLKSGLDLSFANVNVQEAKLILLRAQDSVKEAYADLARALGQDQPVEYRLAATTSPGPPPAAPEPLIADAIQNRPELHELRLRYEAAQRFEAAERDLKRPNVTVVGVGGALPYLGQNPRVTPDDYEGVALNVEVPIFNGHQFSARRQAARYEALAANQRLRDLQQQVEHDVRVAWITVSTAYQRIPVTEELLKQAQLAFNLAQGRYNLGLASIVEVSQAQLNLTQAQIENLNAQYDYQSANASLQYMTGALR